MVESTAVGGIVVFNAIVARAIAQWQTNRPLRLVALQLPMVVVVNVVVVVAALDVPLHSCPCVSSALDQRAGCDINVEWSAFLSMSSLGVGIKHDAMLLLGTFTEKGEEKIEKNKGGRYMG